MKNGFFNFLQQLFGIALVGLIFFMWLLGYVKNKDLGPDVTDEYAVADLGGSDAYSGESESVFRPESGRRSSSARPESDAYSSRDYNGDRYRKPISVTGRESIAEAGRTRIAGEEEVESASGAGARLVREWKGAHRDEDFARECFELFRDDVTNLADEYGLYPEVFMARIIAYSYEFTLDPSQAPADNNFTAMKRPNGKDRARFRSSVESLKAYAVVNAGEINRLSAEGALAKHDRAWTMRKIIEQNAFVGNLALVLKETPTRYNGMVGSANRLDEKEEYKLELAGEAVKMTSKVESTVKKRRAKDAGYDDWEDYIESLPEEVREKQEENAEAVISAVSKKKAFNLSRRVDAKQRKKPGQ